MSFPDPTAPQPQQTQPTQQDQAAQAEQAPQQSYPTGVDTTGGQPSTPPATGDAVAAPKPTEYYCPACGRRVEYRQQCTGSPVAPHQPVEVVDAAELDGDPENHTPAPDSPGA